MLVTFQLHNAKGPIGDAIKDVSGGNITHVSIRLTTRNYGGTLGRALSDDYNFDCVWEARFGEKIKPIPWSEYKYKKSIVETIIFEIDKETAREAISWLKEQEGKGYDWLGVLSFIWFFLPQWIGRWFCSEFAMVFLMKFIAKMQEYDQKQTPYGFKLIALLVKMLQRAYS